jgi:hypothetical protein
MPNECDKPETAKRGLSACWGWLLLFWLIGCVVLTAVLTGARTWADHEEARRSRALLTEQMELLRQGKVNCLVAPDPRFVAEVLADHDCAANVRDLYLGGDTCDQRLGRLRELPNLKCLVLLFADNPDALLERLRGMSTLEELTIDRTFLSRQSIDHIGCFPKLKSLCLPVYGLKPGDLEGIRNHPSIEALFLTRADCDEALIPLLQSMPRLKTVTIQVGRVVKKFEKSLQKALPNCQCRVENVER